MLEYLKLLTFFHAADSITYQLRGAKSWAAVTQEFTL